MFGLVSKETLLQLQHRYETQVHALEQYFLQTHLRELANIIILDDPDRFLECYNESWEWEKKCALYSPQKILQESVTITKKFPEHGDFDLLATRHWVLYESSGFGYDLDDVCERYKDICRFLIIIKKIKKSYYAPMFSEKDLKAAERLIQEHKDKILRNKIDDAMTRYWLRKSDMTYEDREYKVTFLLDHAKRSFSPENEYGIHIKDKNEFAVFSRFTFDDNTEHKSYYMTDENFDSESQRRLK